MKQKLQFLALSAALIAAGCSDASRPTAPVELTPAAGPSADIFPGGGERYVALGTSISMGWASNGVWAGSQALAWPAQLSFGVGHPISLPLIQSPGCTSPLIAPLGAGVRLSGESAAGSIVCAPNAPGVALPTQNVSLATAIAADALQTRPEDVSSTYPWYGRVLPPGTTQLTAALAQQPTLVSIEFGGNEVLNATSGLVAPGVTVVPLPFFIAPYDALLDAIGSLHPKAVLVGLPTDARNFPALRRGDEIWADRAEFAALHVDVSNDCAASPNYINVSIKSLNLVFTAAFTSTHGLPNPVFSCADIPGTQDLVLTPADMAFMNDLLAQMTAQIKQQASARGYAYFSLGALYDRPDMKLSRYSVILQLTSPLPYGQWVSLDGVHPNGAGHAILAVAASRAINSRYLNMHAVSVARATQLAEQLVEPMTPSMALELATRVARDHQGEQLPACPMPWGCARGSARPDR